MKVLVVGAEVADCFAHNVAYTFRAMGHEVCSVPGWLISISRSPFTRNINYVLSYYNQHWLMLRERWVIKMARIFKPNLTIICTATLNPDVIRSIRKISGGVVICWYGDTAANIKRDHIVSGEYDAVFMKDAAFAEKLKNMFDIKIYHLDEACNPAWHKPIAEKKEENILVAGNLYGYRSIFLLKLYEKKFKIDVYGSKCPFWISPQVKALHTGIYLDHRNKAKAFGEAMVCLNTFAHSEGDNLNCRIFETCACGGLLLTERRQVISRCFTPGKEFLDFGSFEECVDIITKLQKDYNFASDIRRAAVKRAHGEHTYEHRIKKILQITNML